MRREPTYFITTLGCKVNQYDSGALSAMLEEHGITRDRESPDIIIVNTCVVTAESERKSRQAIRRIRNRYPNALLAVVGCYPEKSADSVRKIHGVDLIAGTTGHQELACKIAAMAEDMRTDKEAAGIAADVGTVRACENSSTVSVLRKSVGENERGRVREYLKIQDGCASFCGYCIIPYTRGAPRGQPLAEIAGETRDLLKRGVMEIVLTGINISSYKENSVSGDTATLATVITTVSDEIRRQAPGNSESRARLRLSSVEPTVISEAFADTLKCNSDVLCPHFHVSLQSGSASVLSRMNRKYNPGDYRNAVTRVRERFPDAGITTDIIVGFPGESDSEFEESMTFCQEIAFSSMHVFPYSSRDGTPAANMPDQVAADVKRDRTHRMLMLADGLSLAFNRKYRGKTVRILAEQTEIAIETASLSTLDIGSIDVDTPDADYTRAVSRVRRVFGHTGNYVYVAADIPSAAVYEDNRIVGAYWDVNVSDASSAQLTGTAGPI